MRKKWKMAAVVFAGLFLMGGNMVFAAEKIDHVTLSVESVGRVSAGSSVGEVSINTSDKEYTIAGAQFMNDNGVWRAGDTPLIQVDLTVEDGYTFSYKNSGRFTITGHDAKFKKASIYDGGDRMIVELSLKQLEGSVNQVTGVEWEDYTAVWKEDYQADKYEIWLYRNNEVKNKVKTEENSYDFSGKMTQKGNYKFRVRTIWDNKTGDWSEFSDSIYLDAEEAEDNKDSGDIFHSNGNGPAGDSSGSSGNGNGPAGNNSGGSGNGGSPAGGNQMTFGESTSGGTAVNAGWVRGEKGWWYRYADGTYPKNCWRMIDGKNYQFDENGYVMTGWNHTDKGWYYVTPEGKMATGWNNINEKWYFFDASGVMLTGWQNVNQKWYYLNADGAMLTGWQKISDKWYFMNANGERLTGFQNINQKWYYFDAGGVMQTGWQKVGNDWYYMDATGVRIANTWTPDGHFLGENGAMIR